jgi:peptide/nickel transport system permease protein
VSAAAETTPLAGEPPLRTRGHWHQAVRRLGRQPATIVAFVLLVALFVVGALANDLAPQGWNAIDLSSRWQNHSPMLSGWHLLGTDNIGRDVLVRTLYGLHDTEAAALLAALLATLLGVLVGGAAGYYGGWLDLLLMRLTDLLTAFPAMMLMLAAFVFLAPISATKVTLVFAAYMWTFVARVVRARIASLSVEEFVQAARALGASDARIFLKHLLPNAAGTLLASGTALIGQIVLLEATVEFFGFGFSSENRPTLGNLIADATSSGIGAYNFLDLGWWVWAGPAIVLVLVLVCTNLVGDGLDEALNPRAAHR